MFRHYNGVISRIPRSNVASASDCPIAVFRAPEECCPLVKGMDVRLKHAWEKSALFGSQLLVSEVIYFPHPPELPCNVLLGEIFFGEKRMMGSFKQSPPFVQGVYC